MTQLVEDIFIKISLNHCEGDSTVLGGPADLRAMACNLLAQVLPEWVAGPNRQLEGKFDTTGLSIRMENTGLYEAPEVGGGDN
jgi:hypothetical protein